MKHFIDEYKKHPDRCEKLLELPGVKVNLKVDGKPFQVLYNDETDELEFHGRSGDETHIGPKIDDYTRLFSKPVNDAIALIERNVDAFKDYKFMTFEVIDGALLLTAVNDEDGDFIMDAEDIRDIADRLGVDVMPTLWEGPLTPFQKDGIVEILSTGIVPEKGDLIAWAKDMFGSYSGFPKTLISRTKDSIEGIVLFFDEDSKITEFKIVDPSYRQGMKDRDAENAKEREEHAKHYESIYTAMTSWMEHNAEKKDGDRLKSLQKNFAEMMESDPKTLNRLMSECSHVKLNISQTYAVQIDRTAPEVNRLIKKHGDVMRQLFELFIKLYWKPKQRGFVVSPEFQERVNRVCSKV